MNYKKALLSKRKKRKVKNQPSRRTGTTNNKAQLLRARQPKLQSKYKIKNISAINICYILLVTAIGLAGIYQKSIKIYWQQTYHFDILENEVLSSKNKPLTLQTDRLPDTLELSNQIQTDRDVDDSHHVSINSFTSGNEASEPLQINSKSHVVKKVRLLKKNNTENVLEHDDTHPHITNTIRVNSTKTDHNVETTTHIDNNDNSIVIEKHIAPMPLVLTSNDKVFFAGDSLMQGVAPYVKKMLFKQYKIESLDLSKQSTGLTYPKAFDWPTTINETLTSEPTIKLLVVFLGPNDPWDIYVKDYKKYIKFKSELWEEYYRLRIETILTTAKQHNVQVLWLAAPCMHKLKLNESIIYLNELYQSEVEKFHQHFLTTNTLLGCTYEKFSNYIETDKQKIKVRIDDGIHFTPTGQKILAQAIMDAITFKEPEDNERD